jgi:glycosyltransferase involved in cell wall biosynthesis
MRRALRLAIDAANFPRDRRGMGRLAREVLWAALADPAFEVTLIAAKRSDARALRAEFGEGYRAAGPFSARKRGAYDAVWFPWNGMRFHCAAPSLVTLHDVFAFSEPHPQRIARRREQAPILRAAREATCLATDSSWSREQILATFVAASGKVEIVAPAPGTYWSPGSGDALPPQVEAQRYVLLVGAREKRKNARTLIAACAGTQRADESLVIVGGLGPDDRALVVRSGVRAGEIAASDRMLRTLYRNAGVVAVPSTAEGFGLVPLEAMACGAPVIASDSSALPETTGGGALLLDPYDVPRWAQALRLLLDDPLCAEELRARGFARVAALDRDGFARGTLGLLRRLASRDENFVDRFA